MKKLYCDGQLVPVEDRIYREYYRLKNRADYLARRARAHECSYDLLWFGPSSPAAEDVAEALARARAVRVAMAKLEPDLLCVFVLRNIDGMTYEEVGRMVGCSTSTAYERNKKACRVLRQALINDGW